ncbi:unnamed protein product [Onchocerca flexuosa]|uniref:OTU domain-containing protein n=1 Tax=Onchocerca flexuosa TaxID=387005 RepID=A0A183HKU3_9BILA|nr:unnamed protein product [Onchocerca flexuosa]
MHSYRHTGTNSNNEEKRRANNAIASCKNTSLPRNASIKNNHSLGVSPPETNKQPRQSPSEENPGAPVTNSDDEDGSGFNDNNLEAWFEERLRCVRGLVIKPVRGDGACLFRAVVNYA